MSELNLWPAFSETELPRSPKTVVEEAGKGLDKNTKGLIRFLMQGAPSIRSDMVTIQFSFYVPSLSYFFPFMVIKFALDTQYPVILIANQLPEATARDENELTATLKGIFGSTATVATVNRLLSIAK